MDKTEKYDEMSELCDTGIKMGLPEILIEFKTKAQTAVTRSQNGIVAVILEDSTKVGDENLSYTYNYEADIVKSDWTTTNLDYLNKIFLGKPKRVLVERAETGEDFKSHITPGTP